MRTPRETPLAELVLVRTWLGGAKGVTPAVLAKDLAPFSQHAWPGNDWRDAVERSLQRLEAAGLAEKPARARSQSRAATSAGAERALAYLGLAEPKSLPRWSQIRDGALVARALGLTNQTPDELKELATIRGLRTAVLQRLFDDPISYDTTGAGTGQAFRGAQSTATGDLVPRSTPDLERFAKLAVEAARRSQDGRFGEDRVFIWHAWRQFVVEHPNWLSERDYKERLLEANRERFLSLARADLAPFLDPTDVAMSALPYLSTTFHFVCL